MITNKKLILIMTILKKVFSPASLKLNLHAAGQINYSICRVTGA